MTDREINEYLAKKAGFKHFKPEWSTLKYWHLPNGNTLGVDIFDFLNDFNACLKWVVPILREKGLLYFEIQYAPSGRFSAVMMFNTGRAYVGDSPEVGEKPTKESAVESRAFCMAALKYFEEKDR